MEYSFNDIFVDDTKNVERVSSNEYLKKGNIAIIDQGKENIVGYTNCEDYKICYEERIIFGDHTRVFKYVNIPFITGADGTKVLKIKDTNKCKYKYYYYYLLHSYIPNTGYNRHFKWVKELKFKIPEVSEQIEIIEQLDKIVNIISIKESQLENLQTIIKSQFVEMFGDIYENKKKYVIKELDYYTSMITYGLTVRPKFIEKGIDLISAREINTGVIDYDKAPKISEDDYNNLSEKAKPKKNDILFSKTGTIGLCAIVGEEKKFAITQNAARIVPKDNINPIWLLYYLRTDEIQNYCKRQAKGNAVKDFQIQDMKKIPILDCPITIQNEFVEKVKQIDKQKFEIQKSLDEMQELYESLMDKYFG